MTVRCIHLILFVNFVFLNFVQHFVLFETCNVMTKDYAALTTPKKKERELWEKFKIIGELFDLRIGDLDVKMLLKQGQKFVKVERIHLDSWKEFWQESMDSPSFK